MSIQGTCDYGADLSTFGMRYDHLYSASALQSSLGIEGIERAMPTQVDTNYRMQIDTAAEVANIVDIKV